MRSTTRPGRHLGPRGQHKILLRLAVNEGELTDKQRNAVLPEMTDDVAALVLRDNVFQTQSCRSRAAWRRS